MRDDQLGRRPGDGVTWQRLVELGLTHVERLSDSEGLHERWQFVASDGSSLVVVERGRGDSAPWKALVYKPGRRPPGGTSSMRDWVFDWEQYYADLATLLADVASLAG